MPTQDPVCDEHGVYGEPCKECEREAILEDADGYRAKVARMRDPWRRFVDWSE